MKATIDIPEELYRRVKARSALEGTTVREVTITLYGKWLRGGKTPEAAPSQNSAETALADWFGECDAAMAGAPDGPTAREILEDGRNRLHQR